MACVCTVTSLSAREFDQKFHTMYEKVSAVSSSRPHIDCRYTNGLFVAFIFYTTVEDISYDLAQSVEDLLAAAPKRAKSNMEKERECEDRWVKDCEKTRGFFARLFHPGYIGTGLQ